jgi:hypothetical protein
MNLKNRKVTPTMQDKNNKTIELIAGKLIKISHRNDYQGTILEYNFGILSDRPKRVVSCRLFPVTNFKTIE